MNNAKEKQISPENKASETNSHIVELEQQIHECETRLEQLRKLYRTETGHLPAPTSALENRSWKWTIFLTLGFAFISAMVYLLGIAKRNASDSMGIPELFYGTDYAYFAILTFYVIFIAVAGFAQRISGHQIWGLILGFWCAHWLIYDWAWWAIDIGFGNHDPTTFWTSLFYSPLLIAYPPMWLFLTEAILGGVMALYTLTVPQNFKQLLPPMVWLYTVYGNASILQEVMGADVTTTLTIGLSLISVAFGVAIYFAWKRWSGRKVPWHEWADKIKLSFHPKNLGSDPLSLPWIFIILGMLGLMHLFLVLNPPVGLFLGMLPWYFVPAVYLLYRSLPSGRWHPITRIFMAIIIAGFIAGAFVFMNLRG
jgi:hypothetical protein